MKKLILSVAILSALGGCATTGEQYQGNVFDANEVNGSVPSRVVKVLTVTRAQVKVDNSQQKNAATVGGALLGGLGGALAGSAHNKDTGIVGAALGAVGGGAAGQLVNDKALVPGVLITYSEGNQIYSNPQVGRLCDFKSGEQTLVVTLKSGEKRIQPNAECPVVTK